MKIRTAFFAGLALVVAGMGAAQTNANANTRHRQDPVGVTYDAVVETHGELRRNNGATGVTHTLRGRYAVAFGADLSACTVVVSMARATTFGGWYEKPGFMAASVSSDTPNTVLVWTAGVKGHLRDRAFHLIVGC